MIGKLLGHNKVETTARYAHLANDPLKAAANRIASRIADIAGVIPNCDEQDSSQFVVRSIATQAFLAVARARRRACQPAMSFTQCRLA